MKRFIRNIFVVLLCSPMLLYYIAADPFSVIWRKDLPNHPNRAVRGLMALDKHKDIHYDSFIFGSSRSEPYRIDDWKTYIGENAVACHSQQSADNVYGTLARLKYLYKRYRHVENALIIIDPDYFFGLGLMDGYQYRNHWKVTGPQDWFAFHWDFFSAFFHADNLAKVFGWKEQPYPYPSTYVSVYDEKQLWGCDSMIDNGHFDEYYEKYVISDGYRFYERDTTIEKIHESVIHQEQLAALQEIRDIFYGNNTKYRLIVSPLYNLEKFNPTDRKLLEDLFGEEYVFDFSGINEYTKDSTNYYENSHYRPHLCRILMQEAYK